MKRKLMLLSFFVALILIYGCAADQADEDREEAESPTRVFAEPLAIPENVAAMDHILAVITELGERLNAEGGYYGDLHDVIVANGNRQGPEHLELWEMLYEMRIETGATYLYSLIDGGGAFNQVIVDSLDPEDMDPYGYKYEKEFATVEAFKKAKPFVALDAWMDEYGEGLHKSGFAPIFNSKGEIAFLLGIDYHVPELKPFEELWNY